MTRTNESGGFQGAISSMLAVVDVCPACGKLLAEHRRPMPLMGPARCPEVVLGSIPFISEVRPSGSMLYDDATDSYPSSYPSGYPTNTDPTATGVIASPTPLGRLPRRSDLLAMTWRLANGAEDFP
jgi:hypothetical protein